MTPNISVFLDAAAEPGRLTIWDGAATRLGPVLADGPDTPTVIGWNSNTGLWVALGPNNKRWTATNVDGPWTVSSMLSSGSFLSIRQLEFDASTSTFFIFWGDGGYHAARSFDDGATWENIATEFSDVVVVLAAGNGLVFVGGRDATTGETIVGRSADNGTTFTKVLGVGGAIGGRWVEGLATDGAGHFAATTNGVNPFIAWSDDNGLSWFVGASPVSNIWSCQSGLAWFDGRWWFQFDHGGSIVRLYRSADGSASNITEAVDTFPRQYGPMRIDHSGRLIVSNQNAGFTRIYSALNTYETIANQIQWSVAGRDIAASVIATLTWSQTSPFAEQTELQSSDGGWHTIATLSAGTTTHEVALTADALFRVRCYSAAADRWSDWSNEVSITVVPEAVPPIAIAAVSAEATGSARAFVPGTGWTNMLPPVQNIRGISWSGTHWFASREIDAEIFVSANGIDWTDTGYSTGAVGDLHANAQCTVVTAGGPAAREVIAAVQWPNTLHVSRDGGTSWEITQPGGAGAYLSCVYVDSVNNRIYVGGQIGGGAGTGAIWSAPLDETGPFFWTALTGLFATVFGLCRGPHGMLAATTSSGYQASVLVADSADFALFTEHLSPVTAYGRSIRWAPEVGYMLGTNTPGLILTFDDPAGVFTERLNQAGDAFDSADAFTDGSTVHAMAISAYGSSSVTEWLPAQGVVGGAGQHVCARRAPYNGP